jgi:hypothetical protein
MLLIFSRGEREENLESENRYYRDGWQATF